jgi:hypothetical protein
MKIYTFTPAEFERFTAKVQSLVSDMGLTEWNLQIIHEQIGDRVIARTTYDTVSKIASIRLTINIEGDFGVVTDVERLAIHEVLHLLLADWGETVAKMRDANHELAIAQEHAVLNRLMRFIK